MKTIYWHELKAICRTLVNAGMPLGSVVMRMCLVIWRDGWVSCERAQHEV